MNSEEIYTSLAVISDCGAYRYSLSRSVGFELPPVNFIMLNPSTADASQDDPTIRRCVGFAARWGYGRVLVTNLFAYRATNPRELSKVPDPVGGENDAAIMMAAAETLHRNGCIVCAWGARGALMGRAKRVRNMLRNAGCPLRALAFTSHGEPSHPLYLSSELEPMTWRPE